MKTIVTFKVMHSQQLLATLNQEFNLPCVAFGKYPITTSFEIIEGVNQTAMLCFYEYDTVHEMCQTHRPDIIDITKSIEIDRIEDFERLAMSVGWSVDLNEDWVSPVEMARRAAESTRAAREMSELNQLKNATQWNYRELAVYIVGCWLTSLALNFFIRQPEAFRIAETLGFKFSTPLWLDIVGMGLVAVALVVGGNAVRIQWHKRKFRKLKVTPSSTEGAAAASAP